MAAAGPAFERIVRIGPDRCFPRRDVLGAGLILVLALAGCDQTADVVVERVPKDDQIPAPPMAEAESAEEQRMLAAMVLGEEEAVFFKVMGSPETLESYRQPFLSLVSSFKPGDPPTWTMPEGWSEAPGRGERLATITVPADPPLELSVTSLPLRMEDTDAYRLANVNRWRGQLGLAPIERADLHANPESGAETFQVPLEGEEVATVVDITGASRGGMMGGPFASMGQPRLDVEDGGPAETGATERPGDGLAFEKPEGWTEAPGSAFSQAAFAVDDAEVTVSALSASANDLLANVNRWRGQVGMEPLDESALNEQIQTITLGDGGEGHYIVLAGNEGRSILGVIASRDDTMWFVKMTGSEATISREKPRFEQFVESLRFEK